MIFNGRTLEFKPSFNSHLDGIIDYLEGISVNVAASFLKDLDYFIIHKIAPRPESHSEYVWKKTPGRQFRRAIFRKKYYVIYKLTPSKNRVSCHRLFPQRFE